MVKVNPLTSNAVGITPKTKLFVKGNKFAKCKVHPINPLPPSAMSIHPGIKESKSINFTSQSMIYVYKISRKCFQEISKSLMSYLQLLAHHNRE
jgi:hypothetical protein